MEGDMVRHVVLVGIGVLVESTRAGIGVFGMELGRRDVRFKRLVTVGVRVLNVLGGVTESRVSFSGMRLGRRGVTRRARPRVGGTRRTIDSVATRIRGSNGGSSVDGAAAEDRELGAVTAVVKNFAERVN